MAVRLASATRAQLRWVALWTTSARAAAFTTRFDSRLVSQTRTPASMVCLTRPTLDEVRCFVAYAGTDPVCIHWSVPLSLGEEGPELPWISFVGPDGRVREDARIYQFELAGNAIPLTTPGDRPEHANFIDGPMPATGWGVRLVAIRDHMPQQELLRWIAEAIGAPVGSIEEARDL